jgi:uncharacterized repeat protein (TIGR01451 family)
LFAQLTTTPTTRPYGDHGLRRLILLAIAVVIAAVALPVGRSAAAPGTPGTPQAGTPVYQETFENGMGTAAVGIDEYTGNAAADNETYTADPFWASTADCNGVIANLSTVQPPLSSYGCVIASAGGLAQALGELQGESPTAAAGNYAETDYTGEFAGQPAPAAGIELKTTTNQIPMIDGDYYDVSSDWAAVDYNGGGVGCDISDPELSFFLISGGTPLQLASGLDPCTAPGNKDFAASGILGASVRAVRLVSNNIRWTGGPTAGIELFNANAATDGNDSAFDNPQVINVTPQLDKSFNPATITTGQTSTLTLTVTNTSELGAKEGWSFTDNLPAGMTIASPSDAATTCGSGTVTAAAGGTSIAAVGNLAAGQESCAVTVKVTASKAGTYTNNSGNVTTNGLNPPGSATLTAQDADVQITKSASPQTAVPGTNETYSLNVKNNGPAAAENTVVSDQLPTGLTFVSASPGCTFASGKVTCQVGTMASGATASFTVVTKVPSSQTQRIANTATVTTSTPDPNPGDNSSTIETPIGPNVNLELTKTASTGKVDAGGQVMYTLVVNNNGPSDSTNATVDDTLPAGLTLVSAQPSQGSCSGTKCNLGTIADGGSAQVLVTATVAANVSGNVKNTATVIGDQPDSNPKNNEAGSTVEVVTPPAPQQPESEIKVVKSVNHDVAFPGQLLTYTLTVSNVGPDTASNVDLTDTAGLPLKIMSAKPSQGSCKVGRPLTCALGTIPSGSHETVKVLAKVKSLGVENNAASATSSGKDPNPANNIDAARTKLSPKLLLKKTGSPRTVNAGGEVTYHLKATNPMIIATHDVKVCDALPAGLAYVSSSPKAKLADGQACWTLKTLAAGKSKTITLVARALHGAGGNLTNHATVSVMGMKKAARARATVHVNPAPKVATPVTG